MSAISIPYITAKLVPDSTDITLDRPRTLIVGTVPQSKNAIFGSDSAKLLSVSSLSSYEAVSESDLAVFIGTGELFQTIKYAKLGVDKKFPIDLLLIKNGTSNAATTTITFTNNTANKGTLKVDIFNGYEFNAVVNYDIGATPTDLATEIVSQLNNTSNKPFTVSNTAGVITITWADGFVSPSAPIHVVFNDSSLTAAVAHINNTTPTQATSSTMDLLGDIRYTSILWPDWLFNSIAYANQFLLDRFNEFNTIEDGVVYTTMTDSYSNILLNTQTLQGQPMSFWADRKIDGLFGASKGSNNKTAPNLRMAFVACAIDRYRVDGADLSDIVSQSLGLLDYRGGVALASLPYHNMAIPHTKPSDPRWYFDFNDQKSLNSFSISTWGCNRAGVQEITGDARTMWKVDSAGNVNKTWSPLEHLWTSSVIREYVFLKCKQFFSKVRLTSGILITGRSMVNVETIREEIIKWYIELGDNALVVAGGDAVQKFEENLFVSISPENQLVVVTGIFPIVTHVGEIDFTIQISTNYGE